jgi:hypothetical protein
MLLLVISLMLITYVNNVNGANMASFFDIQLFGLRDTIHRNPGLYLKQKQSIHNLKQLKDVEMRRMKQLKYETEKKLREEIKRRLALKFLESRLNSKVMSDFYAGRF